VELTLTRRGEYVAEGTYRLKRAYLDRGPPVVSTGEWTTLRGDAEDENAVVYQLDPDKDGVGWSFEKLSETRIRLLDRDFKVIPGPAPTVLTWLGR